ncbi:MAG: hypothetical protein V1859_06620 [archaeon]
MDISLLIDLKNNFKVWLSTCYLTVRFITDFLVIMMHFFFLVDLFDLISKKELLTFDNHISRMILLIIISVILTFFHKLLFSKKFKKFILSTYISVAFLVLYIFYFLKIDLFMLNDSFKDIEKIGFYILILAIFLVVDGIIMKILPEDPLKITIGFILKQIGLWSIFYLLGFFLIYIFANQIAVDLTMYLIGGSVSYPHLHFLFSKKNYY